ncbi:MAG: hypothetical protein NXI24_16640 [bacterium]|nr:hypothetical protein [bacterium]
MNSQSSVRMLAIAGALVFILGAVVFFALSPSDSPDAMSDGDAQSGSGFSIFDMLDTEDLSAEEELTAEFAALLDLPNPRTGEIYTESEAKKIQYLAKKFPNNDLIPRPLGDDEVKEREGRMQRYEQTGFRITGGEASAEEIQAYYEFKTKFFTDKVELLKFGLATEGDNESGDQAAYARLEKMLEAANRTIARLDERKTASLEIQSRRAAGEFDEGIAPANQESGEGAESPGDAPTAVNQ